MSVTDLEEWDNIGDWLVRFGVWEDDGVWSDTAVWVDSDTPWTKVADNEIVWGEA